jgi:NAD(P)-dependent dehydrogenase (short-subunit alcohol dehydrogenase family)
MKNILLTGATSGIGLETARTLAKKENNLLIIGRDPVKITAVLNELKSIFPAGNHKGFTADLSSQGQIRKVVAEIQSSVSKIDVLINNAGAYFTDQQFSEDAIEMTWATNHLAYMLLTYELMPLLLKAEKARIVNVASHSHYKGQINFEDIALSKNWNGYKAYEQSKLGNVLFTLELAEKLKGTTISVNALHPGVVKTDIAIKNGAWYVRLFWGMVKNFIAITVEKGAETSIFLATSNDVEGQSGMYFDKCRQKWQSRFSQTPGLKEKCWELSCKQIGLDPMWNFS